MACREKRKLQCIIHALREAGKMQAWGVLA